MPAGFTLIEILVVVTVLAIALAIPAARGPLRSPGLEVQAAANRLAQTLRLGRSRAIAADRPVPVVLDLATRDMALDGMPRFVLPASATVAARMADGQMPARQVAFLFAPDGSATGGRVILAIGERRLVVAADWLTGRVGITTP
jgi:general secretion pathway protein H